MKIRIFAVEDGSFTVDITVSSVSYNEANGKYLMAAGGYDIAGIGLPKPQKNTVIDNTREFAFATTDQALQFLDWARKANASARESFTRMLD